MNGQSLSYNNASPAIKRLIAFWAVRGAADLPTGTSPAKAPLGRTKTPNLGHRSALEHALFWEEVGRVRSSQYYKPHRKEQQLNMHRVSCVQEEGQELRQVPGCCWWGGRAPSMPVNQQLRLHESPQPRAGRLSRGSRALSQPRPQQPRGVQPSAPPSVSILLLDTFSLINTRL